MDDYDRFTAFKHSQRKLHTPHLKQQQIKITKVTHLGKTSFCLTFYKCGIGVNLFDAQGPGCRHTSDSTEQGPGFGCSSHTPGLCDAIACCFVFHTAHKLCSSKDQKKIKVFFISETLKTYSKWMQLSEVLNSGSSFEDPFLHFRNLFAERKLIYNKTTTLRESKHSCQCNGGLKNMPTWVIL